jgi:uncharacterized protein (DUF1800 family)
MMRKILASLIGIGGGVYAGACASPAPTPANAPTAVNVPAMKSSGPIQVGDLLPDEQIQQVLNRLTFGARPGDAERVRAMGIENWIDWQLHPERINDSATDSLMSSFDVYGMKTGDIVHDYTMAQQEIRKLQKEGINNGDTTKREARRDALAKDPELAQVVRKNQQLVGQIATSKVARAVSTDRQLDEVMVDFWENHFSVFAGKGQVRLFLPQYDRDVIRPYALGKFRDLLGAVAKSPAMLFFLDNWQSAADSTHETLGRSGGRAIGRLGGRPRRPALEAIAAGRIPPNLPPAIREQLVNATPEQRMQIVQRLQKQAPKRGLNENYARELMELHTLGVDGGYTQKDVQEVARALTGWTFNRQTGEFVFNPNIHDADSKVILGQSFPAGHGEDEGERVLDMLARAPQTAHFVTTKLARHFVSDDPPKELVDRCASTFTKTDGDIRETLRCIVTSPEFFSRTAYRAKVKTPFELVTSALRAMNAKPDMTPRTSQLVARLGQPVFGHQTPEGWPDRGDAWMNTGAILNRINFGLALAAGQMPGARLVDWPMYATLRNEPREEQVDGVVKSLLGGQVSTETRDVLMSGANPLAKSPGAANDVNGMSVSDSSGRMGDQAIGRLGGNGGGKKAALQGGRGGQPIGGARPIELQGLAQVLGLALGAPEFQRR